MERPSLKRVQELFRETLIQEEEPLTRLDAGLESWVSSAEGVQVYWDAYFLRFSECFEEDFSRVHGEVDRRFGDGVFRGLVMEYLRKHPPRTPNLNGAGKDFAAFLGGDELGQKLPFLADLAHLEWLVVESFLSPRSSAAPVSWEGLNAQCLLFAAPSLRLFRPRHPVLHLWDGSALRETECLVVCRGEDGGALPESVDPVTFRLLEGVCAEKTLGEICAGFSPDEAPRVTDGMAEIVKRRWVTGFGARP